MAIKEIGRGKYLIRVYVGRDPITKKRNEINETFQGTRREAEKREQILKGEVCKGAVGGASNMTVCQLVNFYLETTKGRRQESTQLRLSHLLHAYVVRHIGHLRISEVKPSQIQSLLDFLSRPKKGAR
jgi:hypothetical protein